MKKNLMRKLLAPLVIILLSLVAGFYFYSNQAVKITEYQDLKLGMSMDEVIYAMGKPDTLLYKNKDTLLYFDKDNNLLTDKERDKDKIYCTDCMWHASKNEIKKEGGIKNFFNWEYQFPESEFFLEFDLKKKLIQIRCLDIRVTKKAFRDDGIKLSEQCHIAGIHTQSSEDEVIEILGKPSKESLNTKSYVKTMTYKERNLELLLSGKKVYYIVIRKIKK